jgi:hypothetical protein
VEVNRYLLEQNKLIYEEVVTLLNDTSQDYSAFETTYLATLKSLESRLTALET